MILLVMKIRIKKIVFCSTSNNHLKAIEKVNNLSINVLSDDQKNVLEFIEQLYDNKLKKRIIESCI